MSEIEELFCEMSARADFMRTHEMHRVEDEQVEFHLLLRSRRPELTRAQRRELFRQWSLLDRARMRVDVMKLRAKLAATDAERVASAQRHRQAPVDPIYPCPCGESFDLRDGKAVALHRPHVAAISFGPGRWSRPGAPEWGRREPPLA